MRWNSYRYRVEDGAAVIEAYCGEETIVRIPAEIDGYPVRVIAEEAFTENGAEITQIEVPGSVETIEDHAFKMCMSLETLVLHEGLRRIGEDSLLVTAVTSLELPSTVTELKKPWEWGKIALSVAPGNPRYLTDGYGLYERLSFSEGDCLKLLAVYAEDERIVYEVLPGTACIGTHAFEGQMHVQQVMLPDGVIKIEEEAFESCQSLCQVSLPEGLAEIGADAFRYCVSLESLHIPASMIRLGARAVTDTYGWSTTMNGIRQMTVHQDNPVYYHDAHAFYQKTKNGSVLIKYFGKNETWRIPDDVISIGEMAFRRCVLRELSIPAGVQSIEKEAFRECGRLECMHIEADSVDLYVPENPVYRKDEITGLFVNKENGLIYDYAAYDRLLTGWSQLWVRCRMAAFRLNYPTGLTAETEQSCRDMITDHFEELILDLCKREDLSGLEAYCRTGVFDSENIARAIELTTQAQKGKLTAYLMEYRQEQLGCDTFSFEL